MSFLKNIDNEVFLMTCGIITFVSIECESLRSKI